MNNTLITEKEIWSILSKNDYEKFLEVLKSTGLVPKQTKRLAIQATDYYRKDLDTRIRITNGIPEIMQKKGGWNDDIRNEIAIPLAPDSHIVLSAYKMIRNLLTGENIETAIIQTENTIFNNKEYEIKLTHQTGKVDVYNYEVEVYNHDLDPMEIITKFEMPVNSPNKTPEFWKEWNSKVNLSADLLTDEQLLEIIKSYLYQDSKSSNS